MKKPTNDQLNQLADKWLKGIIKPEERELLDKWYDTDSDEPLVWMGSDQSEEQLHTRLISNFNDQYRQRAKKRKLSWSISVAAMIIISLSVASYFLLKTKNDLQVAVIENDISPGGNKAVLTLANGKRVTLNDANQQELLEQQGVKISKTADGKLVYMTCTTCNEKTDKQLFNTIETPRGGQYEIRLPDGTRVWLNAASKLIYPISFQTQKERRVQLFGEAYFEVAQQDRIVKKHTEPEGKLPFVVQTDKQEVEVLGTHFNINSYSDEPDTRTTLLEGSVKVFSTQKSVLLKPNQQAILVTANQLLIKAVNAKESIAWKQDYFMFNKESLLSIMRKISRWYDVDVIYETEMLKSQRFSGTVSRFKNLAELLEKLELTGPVKFKITDKKIIVMPD
uniref:FecR family protein n=1 Tax=Pedobacter schmidteae TaxID=2201271 RepID=UPI000EB48B4B|nr:FecR family protein [Pedobacter schmidteae]